MAEPLLETPKQLAARAGLSERQVRHLIQTGQLEHVHIGCRVHIPAQAFEKFLAERTVKAWGGETKELGSGGLISASASTSPGLSGAAAASAALARQTANRLKSLSQNGSISEGAQKAPVIPLKSS